MTRRRGSLFRDRTDAGRRLAERLMLVGDDVLVLGLPRGGVPVAVEVARHLHAELDVLVARKIGAPRQPELAVGAVTADGGLLVDAEAVEALRIPRTLLEEAISREQGVARDRERTLRSGRPPLRIAGREVVLVDDGLATGATMLAALRSLLRHGPSRVVVAVPVGSRQAVAALCEEADAVVCPHTPEPFDAVGRFYRDFRPTTDAQVVSILAGFRGDAEYG